MNRIQDKIIIVSRDIPLSSWFLILSILIILLSCQFNIES